MTQQLLLNLPIVPAETATTVAGVLGMEAGIQQAIAGLNKHARPDIRIGLSGGKDSTCVALLYLWLVKTGKIPPPASCKLISVDTTYELPPLIENVSQLARMYHNNGWASEIVKPEMENRFLYQLLGRGLFTPGMNGRNRWCTRLMKKEPANKEREWQALYLYGSRIDESNARAAKIANSCAMAGSECGSGVYFESSEGFSYSPITNWRNCAVWDFIYFVAKKLGFDCSLLHNLYGTSDAMASIESGKFTAAQLAEAIDSTARTGCIGCPVVGHDYALERICTWEIWKHLRPYLHLRRVYVELRNHRHRLRKPPRERLANGRFSKLQSRVGPICLKSRLWALEVILILQRKVQQLSKKNNGVMVWICPPEMEAKIRQAIADRTFPRGWTGNEPLATASGFGEADYVNSTTIQPHLF